MPKMEADSEEKTETPSINPSELPFLVTHWLSNFDGDENNEAVKRLRSAASEVASAFSDLGAFGTSNNVSREYECF